jgi:hypothetical protein
MSKYLVILLLLSCSSINIKASDQQDEPVETRSFQLSVFPAVGTDGQFSHKYLYNFSVNVFAGITGGVDGIELGGFGNINRYSMKGFQAAGFGNVVNGNVNGLQAAGFINVVNGGAEGLQGAGFINVVNSNSKVLQGAGFANIVNGELRGLQGAGFLNVASGNARAIQAAGFGNVCGGLLEGIQGAGFFNVADRMEGLQGAGFVNVAGDIDGMQGAGFINVAGSVEGMQAAGFINVATRVNGVQLGIVNVTDSIDGMPIGVLSIVKDGYRKIEFSGGDALNAAVAFKIGVRRFYNLFTLGTQFIETDPLLTYGYGIGSEFYLANDRYLNLEIVSHHIMERRWWEHDNYNMLNQLKVIYASDINDRWQVFAGPVFNFQLRDIDSDDNDISPYQPVRYSGKNMVADMWIGLNAGFRFW